MNQEINYNENSLISEIIPYQFKTNFYAVKWFPLGQAVLLKDVKTLQLRFLDLFLMNKDEVMKLIHSLTKMINLLQNLKSLIIFIQNDEYGDSALKENFKEMLSSFQSLKNLKRLRVNFNNLKEANIDMFDKLFINIQKLTILTIKSQTISHHLSQLLSQTQFTSLKNLEIKFNHQDQLMNLINTNKECFRETLQTLKFQIGEKTNLSSFFEVFFLSIADFQVIQTISSKINSDHASQEDLYPLFKGASQLQKIVELALELKYEQNSNLMLTDDNSENEKVIIEEPVFIQHHSLKNLKDLTLKFTNNSINEKGLQYVFKVIAQQMDLENLELQIPVLKIALFNELLESLKDLKTQLNNISIAICDNKLNNAFMRIEFNPKLVNLHTYFNILFSQGNLELLFDFWNYQNQQSITQTGRYQRKVQPLNENNQMDTPESSYSVLQIPITYLRNDNNSTFQIQYQHISFQTQSSIQIPLECKLQICEALDYTHYKIIEEFSLTLQKNRILNLNEINNILKQLESLQYFNLTLDDAPSYFAELLGLQGLNSNTEFSLTVPSLEGIKGLLQNNQIKKMKLDAPKIDVCNNTRIKELCEGLSSLTSIESFSMNFEFSLMTRDNFCCFFESLSNLPKLRNLSLRYLKTESIFTTIQLSDYQFILEESSLKKLTSLQTLSFYNIIIPKEAIYYFQYIPNLQVFSSNDFLNYGIRKILIKFKRLVLVNLGKIGPVH